MELKENDIVNVINDIKNDILSVKHKIFENANNELLGLYFRIGKYIYENSKYGSKFIDNLSISLKIDFPDATGFSKRNLLLKHRQISSTLQIVKKVKIVHNTFLFPVIIIPNSSVDKIPREIGFINSITYKANTTINNTDRAAIYTFLLFEILNSSIPHIISQNLMSSINISARNSGNPQAFIPIPFTSYHLRIDTYIIYIRLPESCHISS